MENLAYPVFSWCNEKFTSVFSSPAKIPKRRKMVRPVHLVATAEIVRRLGVTTVAVNNWREGSPCREPLNHTISKNGNSNRVSFAEPDLLKWLQDNRPDLKDIWEHSG